MTIPYNLVAICGPNASGKTRLAVALALKFNGEIISVDSRQIYRGLNIGSGKDLHEYQTAQGAVRYHLIDIAEPREIYTLWHYQRDFYQTFKNITARRKLPIAVGGTGLYLEAVLKNYQIPNVPENPELRASLMKENIETLTERLKTLSEDIYYKTDLSSKKRIVRSLEVAMFAKEHSIQRGHENAPTIHALVIGIKCEILELRKRILQRLESRLANGMVEEVRKLIVDGVPRSRLDLFGLECKHIARYIAGEVTFEKMKNSLYYDICHFAKRQQTYFRGMQRRGIPIHWIESDDITAAVNIVTDNMIIAAKTGKEIPTEIKRLSA